MDSGRHPLDRDAEPFAESAPDTEDGLRSSAKPLTHRPRRQSALARDYLKPVPDALAPNESTKDLGPFADQLIAIAERLRQGAVAPDPWSEVPDRLATARTGEEAHSNGALSAALDTVDRRELFVQMARTAYARRRERGTLFGESDLFGEPAWDILLDLYIAHGERKDVSVSSACIGSAAPPTTGLRWLGVLADQGLVEREHDPEDQRRVLVYLTERALDAMDAYFSSDVSLYGDRRSARA